MNINLLHEKLIHAARTVRLSDEVPYAFEKRVMARLRNEPMLDVVALWTRALWRAAIPCVAITLIFSVWATHTPEQALPAQTADLSLELESTLLASVTLDNDLLW